MISVIMPVYNGIQFLQSAIDSILNQTYQDFEFIILDDGSTEHVFDLIKSYHDTRIVALQNEKNIGLTKSLNICLDRVCGQFIARMDGDDISCPNRFEEQLKLFTKGIGLVGCWAQTINAQNELSPGFAEIRCQCSDEDLKTNYWETLCMVDATSMYSREAMQHVGWFDAMCKLGQTYNYNIRVLKEFSGRIVQKELYQRREWGGQVGKYIRQQWPLVSWGDLARDRANEYPIIQYRQL